ncbi:MAG: adenine phosphoribosyltransferase [Dehalococcoidia bacterium]|nr:adenine phosphoribosyltransferase [Dehalococcoidia bacterium]MCA9844539.1 adenine phosphoribosyltransferase [Dehalococcoidia bacterium]MCA9853382.1 adenine phosphoribosyltransferase [Dehalococcoidia bacterium]MCC7390490.1 adenine phosphoribosyltransferase [Phycisphaerales bacterium]
MNLADYVRAVPGFPQPGVLFRDITPLLLNAEAFRYVLDALVEIAERADAESIVGIESRGFIFGTPIADRMGLPFVPVRKPGKLPAARMSVEYSLEYGESQLDIHEDAVARGQRCFIVDDLLATGGTARAAAKLVELIGGNVVGLGFVIELDGLQGRRQLEGYAVHSLLHY